MCDECGLPQHKVLLYSICIFKERNYLPQRIFLFMFLKLVLVENMYYQGRRGHTLF